MPSRLATAHRLTATLRCLLCLGAMLFGAAVPALALASVPELVRPARDQFDFGRYREAIRSVDELIGQKVLTTEAELTEAWRIHGLARLYLGQRAEARASFENLLALDPDFALDPLLVPPMAIEALDEVREAKREFLEPIRARRRQLAEERARAEAETRATLARQPMMIQRIERHSFFANFLPLGAAQLSQQRGRVEHYAEIEAAGREKQPAADHPDGGGEAVFKVFVDRPQLHIVEEFQENEQHHRQCDHSGQPEQQHRAAVVVRLARHGDVADRTEQRREQRDRDRPPLHPAAGEEIILGVFLFMADPAAERKAQQQIERDHRIVDQVHRSSLSGVQPI